MKEIWIWGWGKAAIGMYCKKLNLKKIIKDRKNPQGLYLEKIKTKNPQNLKILLFENYVADCMWYHIPIIPALRRKRL